jgi:hypothetical protein
MISVVSVVAPAELSCLPNWMVLRGLWIAVKSGTRQLLYVASESSWKMKRYRSLKKKNGFRKISLDMNKK